MAEENGQAKTEAPTQRRREEARQQGQVALSTDLFSGILLLVGVLMLWLGTSTLAGKMLNVVRIDLSQCRPAELTPDSIQSLFASLFLNGLDWIGILLALMLVVGVAVGLAQAGFHITPELLEFNWEKLSPVNGWQRLGSFAAVGRTLTSLLKVAAVAWLAWWVLSGRSVLIATLGQGSLNGAIAQGWNVVMRLALAIAAALVLIGVLDYIFQRYRFEQKLRMTRQELKEEFKREEGDPQIKARIRRLQREAAQKRMLKEVPKATVVITNPTHLAIALRYERSSMPAPRVIAMGAGFVAKRIVEVARRHGIFVVERKPLAQALFKTVKPDQEIPPALYYVVAEVLAYVYRLRHAPAPLDLQKARERDVT